MSTWLLAAVPAAGFLLVALVAAISTGASHDPRPQGFAGNRPYDTRPPRRPR